MSTNQNDDANQNSMLSGSVRIDKKDQNNTTSINAAEDMIFNEHANIQYSSDEDFSDVSVKEPKSSLEFSNSKNKTGDSPKGSESDNSKFDSSSQSDISGNSSESESESESESQSESDAESETIATNELEDNETDDEEPIRSKNEKLVEVAPELPVDYSIPESTPIKYLGTISSIVENNVLVQSAVSAEFQVLREGAILCLENRSPLGILFEIFGRLQSPIFRVKFNNKKELKERSIEKGMNVYYVVPSAQFALTSQIRSIRGTDASNVNDEELPESEQEYSDDEEESRVKRERKRQRRNKNRDSSAQRKQQRSSGGKIPNYLKSRFTALPSSKKSGYQMHAKPSNNGTKYSEGITNGQAQIDALHRVQQQFNSIMNPQSANSSLTTTRSQDNLSQGSQFNCAQNTPINSYPTSSNRQPENPEKAAIENNEGTSLMAKMQYLIRKQANAASSHSDRAHDSSHIGLSKDSLNNSNEEEDSYDPANPGF